SIETSILSVTAPGPQVIQGTATIKFDRQINEHGAYLASKDPSKYGFLAAIPDPCDGMIALVGGIRYSLKTLKADGIRLFTRYGNDNHYLGHPHNSNPPIFDYCHKTGRAGVDLLISSPSILRTMTPSVKITLSHAGGDLRHLQPSCANTLPDAGLTSYTSEQMTQDAKKFYSDTALSCNKNQLDLLL
ncbi:MAG: hypothetical protein Q9175_004457, partial [Cornicularia normoerica]